jgi:proteic killer suppression protein
MLLRYNSLVIKSFADKEAERIFTGQHSHRLPIEIQRRAKMRLDRVAAATDLNDLRVPPSHHLEKLSGDRAGQYSIRVNQQWRVCFLRCTQDGVRWQEGHAYDVEIADYH